MMYNLNTEKDIQRDSQARVKFADTVFKIMFLLLVSVGCR